MRKTALLLTALLFLLCSIQAQASVFGQIRGIVHDPQHRPVRGAHVLVQSGTSAASYSMTTNNDGEFAVAALPLGDYFVAVSANGFESMKRTLSLASGTAPILHFELAMASVTQSVLATTGAANAETVTPTSLIDRQDIALTPGADRTNSLAMITDFVPGAYITHDMLHMRGGHQVSWLIDGVQIPNTNIASNLGAQIDPKDIDYLEVQRGSYTADIGDRTYGVFNVVPRSGFERNRQAELILSAGSFLSTGDQLNFGDHSNKFAYYASVNGSRSDYGLSPPTGKVLHDAESAYGGFASFLYNRTPKDQLRVITQYREDFFQIPYDPDPNSFENQQYDSSGLRDAQHERDALLSFSWVRTFNRSTVVQVSPFYHFNRAAYEPNLVDMPVASTQDRSSNYGGVQASITGEIARNMIQGGIYGFGQHDSYRFGAVFNSAASGAQAENTVNLSDSASGGVVEEYLSDSLKAASWLTLLGGLRVSHFTGQFSETYVNPRAGAAVRVPKLNWVFRGFYGRFYQPPPLLTASGPILSYAQSSNTTIVPLHGEHDEEHQFGVQVPLPGRLSGWLLDADTFRTRVNNFLDHSNIGESSIYFPVTVDGALIRGWELTLRSPRLWRFGQAHLAYANQIAEQRGNITGGLVCAPIGDPACDAGFDYEPVDHDQRNTLNLGFNAILPRRIFASTNVYYGSGFSNGTQRIEGSPYPGQYLPGHTTFDLSAGKSFGESTTVSVTALNVANRHVLLDSSLTFGGFHASDPRQIYGEVRYRFRF